MMPLKTLLLAVDLTEMDSLMLDYARFLQEQVPTIKRLVLFHNLKHPFGEELNELDIQLPKPLKELVKEDLIELAQSRLGGMGATFDVLVEQEDDTTMGIVKASRAQGAELIMAGNKYHYPGSGIVPGRLLRHAECDLLFLPEQVHHRMERVLIPTDFSSTAGLAFRTAKDLVAHTGAKLSCQHVFHIPARYFPYFPLNELKSSLSDQAQKRYQRFLSRQGVAREVPCHFSGGNGKSIAQNIYQHALGNHIDMVVMGYRGEGMLVGSVAEGLKNLNMNIPLWVVKK